MKRKLIVNLIITFVILPISVKLEDIFNVIRGEYSVYDTYNSNLKDYLSVTVFNVTNLIIALFALVFVFFPFQLFKDYYCKKNKPLSFIRKVYLLSLIVISIILLLGSFSNIWAIPWYNNLMYFV